MKTSIFACFLVAVLAGCEFADQTVPQADTASEVGISHQTALKVGDTAPEIEGTDTAGNQMRLSEYRGKVVLLMFWGHW